jgi:glycosyltransferase involved in cell wall biosynthesis
MITFSTVTPVYSGQEFIGQLVGDLDRLRQSLEAQTERLRLIEAIFVLDEPIDESGDILSALQETRPWIKVISLSRNFGQHNATVAGILHSCGDWVISLDEDLQHPPGSILEMLSLAANEQADVVLAVPAGGSHGRSYRDASSKLSKKLIGLLSRNKFIPIFSSFRLMRGQVARAAAGVCSHHTYFDVALVWFTSRIISLPLKMTDQRFVQKKNSGYSFFSLLSHAKRLIISSDIRFLNLSMFVGAASFLVAIVLESWVLLNYLFNPAVPDTRGWASLISVTLFYGGIFSLLLGFLLEFATVNMFQGQGRPTFFIVDRSADETLKKELKQILATEAVASPDQHPPTAKQVDG